MSKQMDGIDISLKADADLSSYQYYFVNMTGTNERVALCGATTDVPLGVLQNKPAAAGREALVRVMGHTKVKSGGTLTAGDALGTNSSGSARSITIGTNTTAYTSGICTLGGVSGDLVEMVLLPYSRGA